ncbi:MAG: D-alanyl-D-alanine carboxypeptidase, partial [Desulfobacteraceae bacterium]
DIPAVLNTRHIRNIVLDHTFFDTTISIPGTGYSLNPYDATSGALCTNFNTIFFAWNDAQEKYISAEPQTPLLDSMIPLITESGLKKGRITLPKSRAERYPGELIRYFLKQKGIQTQGNIRSGIMMRTTGHAYESTKSLEDLVRDLMTYSNNFMANQILLAVGAQVLSEPATLSKGIQVLRTFTEQELDIGGFSLAEGSGISRQNRITPAQMIRILDAFRPYHHLLPRSDHTFYKTGTLTGIRTRAGYIMGHNDRLFPFVVMVNQSGSGYKKILNEMIRVVLEHPEQ